MRSIHPGHPSLSLEYIPFSLCQVEKSSSYNYYLLASCTSEQVIHLTFCIVIVKFRVLVLQEKNGSEVVFDNFDIDDIFHNILQSVY